jgi:cytochrome P450
VYRGLVDCPRRRPSRGAGWLTLPLFPPGTLPSGEADCDLTRYWREDRVPRVRLASGHEVFLAGRMVDVQQVFADPRFSRTAAAAPGAPTLIPGTQWRPEMMVNMDPPAHTRLRRLVGGAFTHRRVERWRPKVQALVDELIDTLVEHGPPADAVALLARQLPGRVICEIMGIPAADRPRMTPFLDIVFSPGGLPPEQVADGSRRLTGYLLELIARKRGAPEDDLLTALIQAYDGGDQLTEQELLMTILILFGGGLETTATLLAFSLLSLFRHPQQLALLVQRPELIPNGVEELLRFIFLTPASLPRAATADVEVGGTRVPAGSTVFPVRSIANRDPEVFADPDRLDVTRAGANAHVAFGHGPHFCLGAPVARVEFQVALGSLLARLPGLRLAVPEAELEWEADHIFHPLHALPVAW